MSYYKLYPYADIVIQTTSLTDVQLDFWQQFYRAGLGEYCARNDVNPQDIVHMRSESDIVYTPLTHVHTIDRGLVGIG